MTHILASAIMLIGSFFMLVAAVGVARMPDVFMRLHASTKSATLGGGCLLLAAALYFGDFSISVRAISIVVFLFATAAASSHMLARAAYFTGVPLWEGTLGDDLRGREATEPPVPSDDSLG